jgi:ADP-ribose pyrophosphatase
MSSPLPPGSTTVVDLAMESDQLLGQGGFLAIRRVALRNRRSDGTLSAAYGCDFVQRATGQDAVVVVLYRYRAAGREAGIVEVLLRDGLRPALYLGRDPDRAPLPERAPAMFHRELVAGIIESADIGVEGLLRRAVEESAEEAGIAVTPGDLRLLGAGTLPSPGSMVEKFYFVAAEVEPAVARSSAAAPSQGSVASQREAADASSSKPTGDGSAMEEDARILWMELDAAIAASVAGELCDAKTELGLRRLRDDLRDDLRAASATVPGEVP